MSEQLSKSVTECNREGEEARHTVRWTGMHRSREKRDTKTNKAKLSHRFADVTWCEG